MFLFFMYWFQEKGKCVSCGRLSPNWVRTCPYCGEEVRTSTRLNVIRLILTCFPFLLSLVAVIVGRFSFHWNRCLQNGGEWAGAVSAVGIYLLLLPSKDRDLIVTDRSTLIRLQLLTLLLRLYVVGVVSIILFSGASFFLSASLLVLSGSFFSCYPFVWRSGDQFRLASWILIFGALLLCWLGSF